MDTVDSIVPNPLEPATAADGSGADDETAPASEPESHRRRWGWWAAVVTMLVIALAGACLVLIHVSYVTLAPGSATPTQQLVSVTGAKTYSDHGDILFTTVFINDHVSLIDALEGWLDPTVSVRPRNVILGSRTPSQDRTINLELMDDSKTLATLVALRHLGYAVKSNGTQIIEVEGGTDAAKHLDPGDVITSLDGTPIHFDDDLRAAIATHKPGEAVHLHIDPAGNGKGAKDVDVVLSHQPDDATKPLLGVQIQDYNVQFPITVNIDSGGVAGPSAGLAFTLAVLDVLTPGDLTGGGDVAVTGTIDEDGNVGPVGGVEQKTEAVKRSGAKVFLVPPDEYADAKAHAGKGLKVIAVSTLDQALKVLAGLGGNADALPTTGP